MRFTKMEGAGNDYIYIDARHLQLDWPKLARAMSDRHFGVGGDGIILFLPSDKAHLRMRMFNADGSEGEMCGNGIRCLVKYALERSLIDPKLELVQVETLAGMRTVIPIYQKGRVTAARVNMGEPKLRPAEVPVKVKGVSQERLFINYPLKFGEISLAVTCVSMGNPHAVAFLQESVAEFSLDVVGPQVEHHSMFPKRVNFEIVNIKDRSHLIARVWERGSGETMACGTGACAIAVAARLQGLVQDRVEISLPGGPLTVEWPGRGEVWLEGAAREVFEGEWREIL